MPTRAELALTDDTDRAMWHPGPGERTIADGGNHARSRHHVDDHVRAMSWDGQPKNPTRANARTGASTVTPMSDLGSPVVDGPIPGTGMTAFAPYDLSELGYLEEEYFVSGEALSYELGGDGPWSVSPNERAEYRTRFVVRRPIDSSRFNGTLIVEWLNVSGGTDVEPDWALMHRQIMRDGFAWVGVSAQKVGIEGSGPSDGPHLKSQSPERYGTLKHPGDAYSYDMFSQVGRLVGASSEGGPLGPLAVERLIASGHSQSAAFLVTYVNAIDPLARVYDGYLVHGRGASGRKSTALGRARAQRTTAPPVRRHPSPVRSAMTPESPC